MYNTSPAFRMTLPYMYMYIRTTTNQDKTRYSSTIVQDKRRQEKRRQGYKRQDKKTKEDKRRQDKGTKDKTRQEKT